MEKNGIFIWDEVYPCLVLREDIEKERLYLLEEDGRIAAAFALCDFSDGEGQVRWNYSSAYAVYLDRLGVADEWVGKGIGSLMLEKAADTAKMQGKEVLRLFVVEENIPAIRLYEKNGFRRSGGVYIENIEENLVLREFGYEKEIT